MHINDLHPADQLVMFMQRIYDQGLTTTSGGNLSVRDDDGNIWITPAAIDKGALTPKDISCVKPDGTIIGSHKPSSEYPFHAAIYKKRPDLRAVLHAHPPALVTFSMVRRCPDRDLLPAIRKLCPHIQMALYAVPGSAQLGENISSRFAEGCNGVLLENHGVCVGGTDLPTAFRRFETLEYAANLEIQARRLGTPRTLMSQAVLPDGNITGLLTEPPVPEEETARRTMIALIRRACRQGLFTSALGSYSLRLPDGSFLITPSGLDRALLQEADLVRVRDHRREPGKHPSSTAVLHSRIYAANPGIRAIVLAYPVHAMAFAVSHAPFDVRTIPESYVLLRDMKRLSWDQLCQMPDQIARELSAVHPVAMVDNGFVIVTGETPLKAFDRLEVMESTARSILDSAVLGSIVHISDGEVEDLKVAFELED